MDAKILARRRMEVKTESEDLAHAIARKLGKDIPQDIFNVRAKDPKISALRKEEAMRDFLVMLDESLDSGQSENKEPQKQKRPRKKTED